MDRSLKIALGSLAVSLSVLAIKYAAYWMTGSVALFSDALESIINVVTALAVIVAVKIASRPPDEQHPFGHHKAEYLSAVVVGAMSSARQSRYFMKPTTGSSHPKLSKRR